MSTVKADYLVNAAGTGAPTLTNGAVLPAGSASAPAISPTGDSNTGVFFPAADTVAVSTAGVERMRVDISGNILIKANTTEDRFIEVGNGRAGDGNSFIDLIGDSTYTDFGLRAIRNSGVNASSSINHRGTGNLSLLTQEAAAITFATADTERMRINSNGVLLVGSTSAAGIAAGSICPMGYTGRAGQGGGTANNFNIYWTGSVAQLWIDTSNVGNITLVSDYRIKRNIETQTADALSRVMQLRPVTYQMADYGTIFKASDGVREGFIAHELAEVIPSAVDGEKDAPDQIQSLRVDALVAVLTKAIQEQQAIILSLEARIAALEA